MISVVIPALNESKTIGHVVREMFRSPVVSEVIVVDDGSIDGTPEIAAKDGATVMTSSLLGKGASMRDGALAANNEFLMYVDGDLTGLASDIVDRMTQPLRTHQSDFVKARFNRSGGRVTELSAKPLLKIFFPELLHFEQPLGGVIATRKSLIAEMEIENDYGVDIGILIDMFTNRVRMHQVDIGFLHNDSQQLERLRKMASQVIRTILDRARRLGRFTDSQFNAYQEQELLADADFELAISSLGRPLGLALIDMDGTLIKGRFIEELSNEIALQDPIRSLLDRPDMPPLERSTKIAELLAGTPRDVFQRVAMNVQLSKGAAELVVGLRKRGYAVGIVSDSYFIATEVIRRRVFADFSIAHELQFQDGLATGNMKIASAMLHTHGCGLHSICKHNVLRNIADKLERIPRVVAIGDNDGDACLLKAADVGVAFEPKTQHVANCADYIVRRNLATVLDHVDNEYAVMNTQWYPPYLATRLTGDGIF